MKLDPNVYVDAVNILREHGYSCNAIYDVLDKHCWEYDDEYIVAYSKVFMPEKTSICRSWLRDTNLDYYEARDVRVLMLLLMSEIVDTGGL